VPKAKTSTMLGWPIWLTERASWTKRSTCAVSVHSAALITLIAAFLPMSGCVAE
jgi:hypothetical protein